MKIPRKKIWSVFRKGIGVAAGMTDDPKIDLIDDAIDRVEDIYSSGATKIEKVEEISNVIVDQTGWSDTRKAEFVALRQRLIAKGVEARNATAEYVQLGKDLSDFIKN